MSETVPPPATSDAEPAPHGIRREETRPPDTGRSLTSALAEMQRRAESQAVPVSQGAGEVGAAPPGTPALPPPDATMSSQSPPVSQAAGRAPAEMVVQMQIDGQLVPLTISELQRGYMRQDDYSRKTQQVSVELRRAQEAQQSFANARAVLEQRLPALIAQHQNEFAQPIDWEKLGREDPIGTSQKVARLLAWQQALAEQQHLEQIKQNEARGRKEQMRALGHDVLGRLIPGWADPQTRVAIQQALRSHAISMGYSAEEVDRAELLDPRDLWMAWKSWNYDRLMAQRVQPQPVGTPVYAGNGVRRAPGETPQLSELEERFAQTHRLEDALAIAQLRGQQNNRPAVTPRPMAQRYR